MDREDEGAGPASAIPLSRRLEERDHVLVLARSVRDRESLRDRGDLVAYAIVDFYAAAKANAGKVGMRSGGGLHFLAGAQTCTDAYLEKAGA
jgi:hypothetical protein